MKKIPCRKNLKEHRVLLLLLDFHVIFWGKERRKDIKLSFCWLCRCDLVSVWQSAGFERVFFPKSLFWKRKTLEQEEKRVSRFYNGAIFHAIELGRGNVAYNVRKACRKRRCWFRSHLLCMSSACEKEKFHCVTRNWGKWGEILKLNFLCMPSTFIHDLSWRFSH